MEVDEGFDQKSDIKPHWKVAHARLKNEFTEGEKYHNLMRWLNAVQFVREKAYNVVLIAIFPGDGENLLF